MERVDANLIPFAKNNPSGYRFAFGTDTATDDINANYNDNIKKGWGTTPNEFPEVEDFNAMAYTSSYLTAYLYQMGISEWNNKQNYRQYSRAIGSDGVVYKAKTGTDLTPNVNNNPTTDSTNWEADVQFNINTFTDKTTPINTDNLAVQEVGGLFKKISWANIKATILSSLGVMFSTATAKTTPVGADIMAIGDSAAANATKQVTLTNLKTFFSPASSETVSGIIELATTAEAQTGTDDTRAITPLKLRNAFNATGTAPIYACRAWAVINGTGTIAIRGSGNFSSITDSGVGIYDFNMTTAMPDVNYALTAVAGVPGSTGATLDGSNVSTRTVTTFRIITTNGGETATADAQYLNVTVTR